MIDPPADWVPAFPGQRPPYPPGHEVTMRHGAYSDRRVAPRAAQIEQDARTSSSWPRYLNDPAYATSVQAWARAEAVAALLFEHLAGMDLAEALTDTAVEESEETKGRGRPTTKVTTTRRTAAVLELYRKYDSVAANHRGRLGLDPLSRARLGKDVAIGEAHAGITRLQSSGAELVAKARAAGALPGDQRDRDGDAHDDDQGAQQAAQDQDQEALR